MKEDPTRQMKNESPLVNAERKSSSELRLVLAFQLKIPETHRL
jgi:hypothetical protein